MSVIELASKQTNGTGEIWNENNAPFHVSTNMNDREIDESIQRTDLDFELQPTWNTNNGNAFPGREIYMQCNV